MWNLVLAEEGRHGFVSDNVEPANQKRCVGWRGGEVLAAPQGLAITD